MARASSNRSIGSQTRTRSGVVSRRALLRLVGAFSVVAMGAVIAGPVWAAGEQSIMTPVEAHDAASAGEVILLDIRTADEWAETGVPASGHAVSMHVPGFLEKLAELNGGDPSKPVALICARGNRSAFLKGELEKRGFTQIIDVSEGIIGGQNGPGWMKRGLPLSEMPAASQ